MPARAPAFFARGDAALKTSDSGPTIRLTVADGDNQDTANPRATADTAPATRSQQMAVVDAELAQPDRLLGQSLAERYEITREIGRGGMGVVYEARHALIGKRVAVKVLLEKYAAKDQVIARLEQEARLASSIGHEHIVDITDFGSTNDGRRFVVMEYLEGESLAARIARQGNLDQARLIAIGRQIASALGAAHEKGIVHRDLKPENVFLVERAGIDFVKVVDFGISKTMRPGDETNVSPRLTQTGMVLGTPLYMSPEQGRGDDDLDHRIDVWALGVILFEGATGEVPFRGANYLSVISQVLSEPVRPPSEIRPDLPISADFDSVVLRALAKDREQRYQSMDEFEADLVALAEHRPVAAATVRRETHADGHRSRLRMVGWLAALGAVIWGTSLAASAMLGDPSELQPAAAPPLEQPVGPPPEPAPAPAVAPAPPNKVTIRIESKPEGAQVFAGDRLLGTTNLDLTRVEQDRPETLRLVKEGYEDAEAKFNPATDGAATVLVELTRARPARRGRAAGARAAGGNKAGSAPTPSDSIVVEDDTLGGELQGNPVLRKKRQQE